MAKRKKTGSLTAFQYDNATTGAGHPVEFGVIPGTWEPGVPVLASAFGMSDDQLRDAIGEFNLPIEEVTVDAADAVSELSHGPNRMESEQEGAATVAMPDHRVRHTDAGPIPAAPNTAIHPPLQPLTAAMQAKNTVLSKGGTLDEAADAAEAAGGAAGAELARLTRMGIEQAHVPAEDLEPDDDDHGTVNDDEAATDDGATEETT